jgi:hypothetical protein
MKIRNPKIWGPPLWDILHYITFRYDPKDAKKVERLFMYHLPNLMPCIHCRNHYKEYVRRNPIKLRNREELSKWLVRIHNLTNQQLKKPQFAYSKAVQRYSSSSYAKERVKNSFIKWTALMRTNILYGTPTVQKSYSTFLSYIFNYV